MNFKRHISVKCKTAMWHIHQIKNIRAYLTQDACETLVLGMVISHLDYANSLFIGLPLRDINRLQRVQNIAAKLVLNNNASSQECLKQLHWLPIHLRVQHKVLTLVYRCLNGHGPKYLKDKLELHSSERTGLRSNDMFQRLKIPFTKHKTFAGRSFRGVAALWWNNLPNRIKQSNSIETFKATLKTFLFTKF